MSQIRDARIWLTLCFKASMPTAQPPQTSSGFAGLAHVLLVDGEFDSGYAPALRNAGYRVTEVHDGQQAWKQVLSQRPQVVVTDLTLQATDSLELCRRLRAIERTAGLPTIMVTGLALIDDVATARSVGFDAVLLKPCEPSRLLEEIQRTLADSAGSLRASCGKRRAPASTEAPLGSSGNAPTEHRDRRDGARSRAEALQRIRGEYNEMPGLTLTLSQAARLWRLDKRYCEELLEYLVNEGFLRLQHQSYSRP